MEASSRAMSGRTSRTPSPESSDVFSLSDQVLAEKLQFIEEIGFGNWGSVWVCRPRPGGLTHSGNGPGKIAVKLVHRSKTSTTAARVKSLWNEMKIVRSLEANPHPSIVPFYSFVITPSYALITMAYLPTLVPVEVAEHKAFKWFRSLASGVDYLHKRGIVHNDIKPANILLSGKGVPVLVDFGFAEKYDIKSPTAFHSNLSYGTPEYLSPERARGLPHDTRKSDVWSLGVSFFEILCGRTPFEHADTEQFTTKEDLEKYWARTLRGSWVGTWRMSQGMEALLRRMIAPNADLRCTATQVMLDAYWFPRKDGAEVPRRSASMSSVAVSKSATVLSTASCKVHEASLDADLISCLDTNKDAQAAPSTPPGLKVLKDVHAHVHLPRSKSQACIPAQPSPASSIDSLSTRFKRVTVAHGLSPIKASPPTSPRSPASPARRRPAALGDVTNSRAHSRVADSIYGRTRGHVREQSEMKRAKEYVDIARDASSLNFNFAGQTKANRIHASKKTQSQVRDKPTSHTREKSQSGVRGTQSPPRNKSAADAHEQKPSITGQKIASKVVAKGQKVQHKEKTHARETSRVYDRVLEWEREKQRLREMARLEDFERERDEFFEPEPEGSHVRVAQLTEESESERQSGHVDDKDSSRGNIDKENDTSLPQVESGLVLPPRVASSAPANKPLPSAPPATPIYFAPSQSTEAALQVLMSSPNPLFTPLVQPSVAPAATRSTPSLAYCDTSANVSFNNALSARPATDSVLQSFTHHIRKSIDKTFRFYKSSTQDKHSSTPEDDPAMVVVSAAPDEDISIVNDVVSRRSVSVHESWENASLIREAKSSLPVVRHAIRNERVGADNKADRMTIWMRNVEKVVEDAKHKFESEGRSSLLPPIPLSPASHRSSQHQSRRNSRVPRKIPAAYQIFADDSATSPTWTSFAASCSSSTGETSPTGDTTFASIQTSTKKNGMLAPPSLKGRRASVTGLDVMYETESESPSKRKEKSRSHGDLVDRRIAPMLRLEVELEKYTTVRKESDSLSPQPSPRLAEMLPRSVFIATPPKHDPPVSLPVERNFSRFVEASLSSTITDELTSTPLRVEPYQPRVPQNIDNIPDTPERRRTEEVYDRFLMASSGVVRVGKGYQSGVSVRGPISHTIGVANGATAVRDVPSGAIRGHLGFSSTRRQMPPPVSSDDVCRTASVDELGTILKRNAETPMPMSRDEPTSSTVARMRRALKVFAPGKTVSQRLSRMA